jgi:nicotinate-nucleotide adenylyltransferase
MIENERIGILGGTFDPIHNTHLAIARAVLRAHRLDRILFMVAGEPPHKRGDIEASAQDRLDMVNAALVRELEMASCDIEVKRDGPSYTADTLDELRALYPDAALFLIMGLDSLVDLPNWHAPERIYHNATILAVTRPGSDTQIPESLDGRYALVPFEASAVSSTEIRARLKKGQSAEAWLHPAVEELIKFNKIYEH